MKKEAFLNAKQAADLIGVSPSWIYLKSSQGAFPSDVCFRAGLYLRFDADRLIAWIRSGQAARPATGAGRPKKVK